MLSRLVPTLLLVAACGVALAAAPPDPLVRPEGLEPVSAHVQVIPDDSVPLVPNVGFVIGSRAVLVVDTGLGPRNGKTVLDVATRLAPGRQLYLVTTHVHPEHDLGAQAFPASAQLIRSTDQVKDIAEFGLATAEQFSKRSPLTAELLQGATFRKADIVFDKERRLDLGGVSVRIIAMGANHTAGDTAVFVEPDRVLFSGDVTMRGQPAFASPHSSLSHWLTSLDRFDGLKPLLIVPSHGKTGDATLIGGYRTYLTRIRDETAAQKRQGKGVEEAVQAVTAAMSPSYPDAGRLGGAVRTAYKEAP